MFLYYVLHSYYLLYYKCKYVIYNQKHWAEYKYNDKNFKLIDFFRDSMFIDVRG